jgi:hypothetical protein
VVLAPSGSLMDLWSLAQERETRGNSDLPHGRRRGTTSTVLLQRHCGSTAGSCMSVTASSAARRSRSSVPDPSLVGCPSSTTNPRPRPSTERTLAS